MTMSGAPSKSKSRRGISPVYKQAVKAQDTNPNKLLTLMIVSGGRNVEKLERALNKVAVEKITELAEIGQAAPNVRCLVTPTLNPKVISLESLRSLHVDYILITLDPTDSTALDKAEFESALIEMSLVARKRVGFCFWQRNSNTIMDFTSVKLRAFSKKFTTCFDSIREDDDDSVEYNAQVLYSRVKRLVNNPLH